MNSLHSHRDNVLTREQAEPLLRPLLGTIKDVCLQGFTAAMEFGDKLPHLRAQMTPRTMANIINDAVVQQARALFAAVEGVQLFEDARMLCLDIQHQIALRFKKLDDSDRTANVKTERQKDIAAQFLYFPGWKATTWVSAGYHLTKACDAIDRIVVVCWYADYRLWDIPVYDAGADGASEMLPFTGPPPVTPAPERKSRVRAKNLKDTEGL